MPISEIIEYQTCVLIKLELDRYVLMDLSVLLFSHSKRDTLIPVKTIIECLESLVPSLSSHQL